LAKGDEVAHDGDVHHDRSFTFQDTGQHGDALFREGEWEVFPMLSAPGL
jgi:hypothetical protein